MASVMAARGNLLLEKEHKEDSFSSEVLLVINTNVPSIILSVLFPLMEKGPKRSRQKNAASRACLLTPAFLSGHARVYKETYSDFLE